MAEPTLEEMAQALARGQQQLAEAQAAVEEMRPEFEAREERVHELRDALRLIVAGMENTKRRHVIERAVEEMGIETDAPATVFLTNPHYRREVYRYDLVAVGREGTPLYLNTPERSHRYRGRTYARPLRRDDQLSPKSNLRRIFGSDLVEHEERGSGAFGAGSGSIKPKAPPEGGRWRWLKVRDQEALEAAS